MRRRRLVYNTMTSFFHQIITIVCGFIVPRLILSTYGSEVNGLISSILQFLQFISFLELGMGAVIQAALYKPISDNNTKKISEIITSAEKFFVKLAKILFVYIVILAFVYPFIVKSDFSWIYTATLIGAMSISSFAQYYFGIVDNLFLNAYQIGYIQYMIQICTLIMNVLLSYVFIRGGATIQIVKLVSSMVYLCRPMFVRWYINKRFDINRKMNYVGEPIAQKWNGIAQHIAAIVLDGTDVAVLTLFSTLSNVSIYSIYYLIINGVKQLFMATTNGIQALMGELWAKQDITKLKFVFEWIEWLIHTVTVFIFGCTSVLIVPFVSIYTNGVRDANYNQPIFALILVLANAGHCIRLPYNVIILATGHFKQTQQCYVIASVLNILISVIAVKEYGLIGVAIGTLVAMSFQTIWMAYYNSKTYVIRSMSWFLKQIVVDILIFVVGFLCTKNVQIGDLNYMSWIIMAIKIAVIWGVIVVGFSLIFYKNRIVGLYSVVSNKIKGKEKG